MKESAIFERNLIRDCDVEGAINGTYEILYGKRSAGVSILIMVLLTQFVRTSLGMKQPLREEGQQQ